MARTAPASYSTLQKLLHWAVVVLLALQYFAFDSIGRAFRTLIETGTPSYSLIPVAHIVVGLLVLALTLWRLALRVTHGAPALPEEEPGWAGIAAKLTHGVIYLLLLALPVSGMGSWFLASRSLAELHEAGTSVLMLTVLLHVAAVLVHQFWWKTGLARRMM